MASREEASYGGELALGIFLMSRDLPTTPVDQTAPEAGCRKPYAKPQITAYGRVEDMTRAGGKTPGEPRGRPKGG